MVLLLVGMAYIAAFISNLVRLCEKILPIAKNAELYLSNIVDFKEASNEIVRNVRRYVIITIVKIVCDFSVFNMAKELIFDALIYIHYKFQYLIDYGFETFINGIILSLKYFFICLRNISITLILNDFKNLYKKQKNISSSIILFTFVTICINIYVLIISIKIGLIKVIQLEIFKYWLECMGIIRAIVESYDYNFLRYYQYWSMKIGRNNTPSTNNIEVYERVGVDLIYNATISLEDVRIGTPFQVPLINGEMMECDLYKNTVNLNKEIIIDHAGLPDTNNGGIRGQLIVKWDIELPDAKIGIEPTE